MKFILYTAAALAVAVSGALPPSCERPVFCNSKLLHHVQLARLNDDSKTFVDSHLRQSENETLAAFDELLNQTNNNPSREQIRKFVDEYFNPQNVLEAWKPPDYNPNPSFLSLIVDPELREYGKNINNIWPTLGRKVGKDVFENPDRYSLIPVNNGFIVPGGRFQELYYWDTYWVIEGLLISGMQDTVKGMIENLIELLNLIGHIPNGSRWYYQQRSQPPLLSAMMALYFRQTSDSKFVYDNLEALEKELKYWIDTQSIKVSVDKKEHTLLRYNSPSLGPRPESYYEDYTTAQVFVTDEERQDYYTNLKSAAESGWDFSSRWFVTDDGGVGNLTDVKTLDIIPVDQNAMFVNAMTNLVAFHYYFGNRASARRWAKKAAQWMEDLDSLLWNEEDGIWYDYNLVHKEHQKQFYASNVAPLWMNAVDEYKLKEHAPRVLEYLKKSGALKYPGGVPTSLIPSGEQWDYPNAWPPLVSMMVNALEALDLEEGYKLAFETAQSWVRACYKGFKDTGFMFEKYNVETPGSTGGGGEYVGQTGFGWSNGVVQEFLVKFGHKMTAYDNSDNNIDGAASTSSLQENENNVLKMRMSFNLQL